MNISLRPLVPLLALLALAACDTQRDPETADVAAQGLPPTIRVTTSEQRHLVYVAAGTGALADPERASLVAFISDASLGSPDALHLRLRGTVPREHLAAVTKAIVGAGVNPTKIEIEAVPASDLGAGGGHPPGQAIEIVATVSRVEYPTCPREAWTGIGGSDNPNSSNYGCSSITNLEAMVADPRDLVQGESGGQTDAQLTNAAIERLRTDKVKKPESTSTSSVGGGGGS
jgi:pilus assembly protein CpaD